MKKFSGVVLLAATALSCNHGTDGAVLVTVNVDANLKASCFELVLSKNGNSLASQALKLVPGQAVYYLGVKQEDRPASVTFRASAYTGDCADTAGRKLASHSDAVEHAFPKSGVEEVVLTLSLPGVDLDADRDGYVDIAQGGTDCDDTRDTVHPNQSQACDDPRDVDCDGKVGCADSDCASYPACLNAPTALQLTPAAVSLQVGQCSNEIAVTAVDAAGIPRVLALPTAIALSTSAGGVGFFSDAACSTALTSVNVAANQSSGSFYVKGSQVVLGASTVTARALGLADGELTLTIRPVPIDSIIFIAGPANVTAGDCSSVFTVELLDSTNAPTVTAADLSLGVTPSVSTGTDFFEATDTSCTTRLSAPATVTVPMGQSTVSFRMLGQRRGTLTLTANLGAPAVLATWPVTIDPAAPSKLVFITGNPGLAVQTCSPVAAPVTVQLQDRFGNFAPAPSGGTVVSLDALDSSQAVTSALAFFADPGCGTAAPSVTIPSSSTTVSFFAKGSAQGSYTMRARATGLTEGTRDANIVTGPPTRIKVLPTVGFLVTAGQCSSAVRVQTQDVNGSPSAVPGPTTVQLTGSSTVTYFADSACTTALSGGNLAINSGTEGIFYFSSTQKQTFAITATVTSSTNGNPPVTAADTVSGFIIDSDVPNRLVWTGTTTATITAGGCSSAYTVELRDQFGNPTFYTAAPSSGLVVTPSQAAQFSSAASCAGASTTPFPTVPTNTGSFTFYATSTTASSGAMTLTAAIGAVASQAPQATLTVNPGAASQLVVTAQPSPLTIQAGDCVSATVQLRDALGNAVNGAPTTVNLSANASGFDFYATAANCTGAPVTASAVTTATIPNTGSTVQFSMRGRVSGQTYTVTANAGLGTAPTLFPITVTPAVQTSIGLANVPASLSAGTCEATPKVQRFDRFGNLAVDAVALAVTLDRGSAPAGDLVFSAASDCSAAVTPQSLSIPSGSSEVTFSLSGTSPNSAATLRASATIVIVKRSSATVNVTAAAPSKLVFTTGAGTLTVGTCSTQLTLQSLDSFGNPSPPAAAATVNLASNSAGTLTFYSGNTCSAGQLITNVIIPTSGTTASFYFKSTQAPESPTITASTAAPGYSAPWPSQQWTVTAGVPSKLVWQPAPPNSLARFSCSAPAIGVQVQDALGNVVNSGSARTVTLSSTNSSVAALFFGSTDCTGLPVSSVALGAAASSVSLSMTVLGTTGQTTAVTASDGTLTTTPAANVTVAAASTPGALQVTATSTNVEYTSCQPVLITRKDNVGALWTKGATAVAVSVPAATFLSLHTTAACAGAGATTVPLVIPDGSSAGTVYAKGHSGSPTPVTVTASDALSGFSTGTLGLTALPLVRRGTCVLADTQFGVSCPVSPAIPANDISRSFLVFQAVRSGVMPKDSAVACHLSGGAAVTVDCERFSSIGDVGVAWQVASFGTGAGVSVQHLTGALSGTSAQPFDLSISPVTLNNAFVLFSSASYGMTVSADDFATARLASASGVRLANVGWQTDPSGDGGFKYSLEVVQMSGTNVDRGQLDGGTVSSLAASGLTSRATGQLVPMYTVRFSGDADTTPVCKRRFRANAPTATGLTFTRGNSTPPAACTDNTIPELAWERVEFPAGTSVTNKTTSFNGLGDVSGTENLPGAAVDHRVVLLAGGQGPGGLAAGETDYATDENLGAVHALLVLDGGAGSFNYGVFRATSDAGTKADFTVFAVQFAP